MLGFQVRYYEGTAALKWKDVLHVARSDPEAFWDEGGWDAIFGTLLPALSMSNAV